MRTIKFRGKKQNGEWVYGSLLSFNGVNDSIYYQVKKGREERIEYAYVHPRTVGQYTGLIDKNGKEIYEGDVLANVNQPNKCIVEWNRHLAQFQGTWTNMPITAADIYSIVLLDYRVFGNIHDNPELLNSL